MNESKTYSVLSLEMHFELYREKSDKKDIKYYVLIHLTFEMEIFVICLHSSIIAMRSFNSAENFLCSSFNN